MVDAIFNKKEAVYWHRKMWNWIAQTSIQEQRCVYKIEALEHFGFTLGQHPKDLCFCCEYAFTSLEENCALCPVVWSGDTCCTGCAHPEYKTWMYYLIYHDYIQAAKWAYKIAELPERKNKPCDY